VNKVGMNYADVPQYAAPNVVGVPKLNGKTNTNTNFLYEINAYKEAQNCHLRFPIESALDIDWDDLTDVITNTLISWQRTLTKHEEISEFMSTKNLIFTERIDNIEINRKKLYELAFEVLDVPKVGILDQSLCALFSEGKTTGLVIDSGETSTSVVPIFDSKIQSKPY